MKIPCECDIEPPSSYSILAVSIAHRGKVLESKTADDFIVTWRTLGSGLTKTRIMKMTEFLVNDAAGHV